MTGWCAAPPLHYLSIAHKLVAANHGYGLSEPSPHSSQARVFCVEFIPWHDVLEVRFCWLAFVIVHRVWLCAWFLTILMTRAPAFARQMAGPQNAIKVLSSPHHTKVCPCLRAAPWSRTTTGAWWTRARTRPSAPSCAIRGGTVSMTCVPAGTSRPTGTRTTCARRTCRPSRAATCGTRSRCGHSVSPLWRANDVSC